MLLNNWVNILLTVASAISLTETPITKAIPPVWPLFRLCLIMEKITGPTEMLSNNPKVIPLIRASSIEKYHVLVRLYIAGLQKPFPVFQHFSFHNPWEFMLTAKFSFQFHEFHEFLFR